MNFGGTFEENFIKTGGKIGGFMFEFLKDYTPERVTDGFEVIKGAFNCNFNYIRIEEYKGDKPEFEGRKFLRYELVICDGQDNAGRKLWKSVDLTDEKKVKKLADAIWTVTGLDFKDEETLQVAINTLVDVTVEVKAWGFVGQEEQARVDAGEITKDQAEKIQQHIIKGKAKKEGESKKSEVPF